MISKDLYRNYETIENENIRYKYYTEAQKVAEKKATTEKLLKKITAESEAEIMDIEMKK